MRPTSGILRFAVTLLIVYGLLAAPWPGLKEAYSTVYRATCNWVFGSFGENGKVRFEPLEAAGESSDTEITTQIRGGKYLGAQSHSPRLTGYLPTVELIALVIASPIAWRRRWKALLLGFLISQAFVALRILISLFLWFSSDRPWQLFDPGPFWRQVLVWIHEIVNVSPTISFLAPVFIWIAVTVRKKDLDLLVARFQAASPSQPE